ncbi:MAG: hypothetical protein R3C14_28555 [Caldilineaceae bacterium]
MSNRAFGLIILMALLFTLYTLTSAGRFHIVDEVSLFAVTESLVLRGDVDTNAIAWTQWVNSPGEVLGAFGPDGQVYSKKGPAPAFVATLWYALLHMIAHVDIAIGMVQGTLLWNGLVTALTAALLWLTVVRLGYSDRTGVVLGLLFGLCTIAWPYANHFFGEPLSALGLLACFYCLLSFRQTARWPWMAAAGCAAGLVVATVVAHLLLVALLALYWLLTLFVSPNQKFLVGGADEVARPTLGRIPRLFIGGSAFALPLLVTGALLLWYNSARFGNPFDTGYHFDSGEGFTAPLLQGLWGLLFSPYRGVFWYSPILILALVLFGAFVRRHWAEGLLVAALSLVLVGLYSRWWMWWGGFAWGPRFLVPLTPFWILPLAPLVQRLTAPLVRGDSTGPFYRLALRRLGLAGLLLVGLAFVSLVVQVLAVSVNYVNYEIKLRDIFPTNWEDPLQFGPPAQGLADWLYSPVLGQWQLLRENLRANTDLAWFRADGTIYWLTVLVGLAALITLSIILVNVYLAGRAGRNPVAASTLMAWITPLIPLTVLAVWLGQSAADPHYGAPEQGYRAVLTEICQQVKPTDAVVTVAPYAYQVAMNWLPGLCQYHPPIYGYATNSLAHPEAEAVMTELMQTVDRLWFVTGGLPANDPDNSLERWLANTAYEVDDRWFDDYRLVRFGTPLRLFGSITTQLDMPLSRPELAGTPPEVMLLSFRAPTSVAVGAIFPVQMSYELGQPLDADLHWFVQLLSAEGYPIALVDTTPVHGYASFPTLPVGEVLVERVGLQLPDNVQQGLYRLIAGLYDPTVAGGERLQLPNGKDVVDLGMIEVFR